MGAWGGSLRRRRVSTRLGVSLLLAAVVLAACGGGDNVPSEAGGSGAPSGGSATPSATPSAPVADPERAVDPPGPLEGRLWAADIMIYGQTSLTPEQVAAIKALDGVDAVEVFSLSQVSIENQVLTVAAVNPTTYRHFNPVATAQEIDVWTRIAGGELALPPETAATVADDEDFVKLGNDKDAPRIHIGVYAAQVPRVDMVVNSAWGKELGMVEDNAMLVSTGMTSPQAMREPLRAIIGKGSSIQDLDAVARYGLDPDAQQTAILTGGSVAQAVGSFNYRVLDGGRIAPDQAWVQANIRTEEVPILGRVTCHKAMLPQLRAAMTEILTRGLADKINRNQYAGCYYPRFIANTQQLSLHSFGIAVDLNVAGNQRGTVGEMDRTVVEIFKKWGFAWGGDWAWTDPMHFEMNAVVKVG
ncbi:M15 family metallopeptidase [Nocardioides sp. AE5]|uniref:M15 family metallopeptidase n=1 Tax=Nocardioides sp. AE5 TaxID=2962573 RepID=UPI002882797C|nr:M15 family metallopeptidase [Nocardioides sp. AE5]MDT0202358.1 M15 family metallopeptidase [Nocardioides sp. AE5]